MCFRVKIYYKSSGLFNISRMQALPSNVAIATRPQQLISDGK